jgi:hypothetical protein
MKNLFITLSISGIILCFVLLGAGCKKAAGTDPIVTDTTGHADTTVADPPPGDTPVVIKPVHQLPERRVEIYLGLSGKWEDMLDPSNYDKWDFVRNHVDGFYVSFVALWKRVYQHSHVEEDLVAMNKAFTSNSCFFETSMETKVNSGVNGANNEQTDKKYIDLLMDAGFSVDYTSLNYGIDAQRVKTLRTYKGERKCLALLAPWEMGGDINSPGKGVEYQSRILSTDGFETDGPLGLWSTNHGNMQEGSYSLTKFAAGNDRISAVMLAPYDAGVSGYDQAADFMNVAKSCVFGHEDQGASPDMWTLWEYGADDDLPAFPETITNSMGKTAPANTRVGMAYWLLKHLNDLPEVKVNTGAIPGVVKVEEENDSTVTVTLSKKSNGTMQYSLPVTLSNDGDPAVEISPVVRGIIHGDQDNWQITFKLNGEDVTDNVVYNGGLNCVGDLRLKKTNDLTLGLNIKNIHPASVPSADTVTIETISNISNTINKAHFTIIVKAQ